MQKTLNYETFMETKKMLNYKSKPLYQVQAYYRNNLPFWIYKIFTILVKYLVSLWSNLNFKVFKPERGFSQQSSFKLDKYLLWFIYLVAKKTPILLLRQGVWYELLAVTNVLKSAKFECHSIKLMETVIT